MSTELTIDEQRLIVEFRRLTPAGKDKLLAAAAELVFVLRISLGIAMGEI